jgi:LPS sulfotransferase NodH
MAGPFESFVILGAMRTGSNLLEANLNRIDGLTCHGEAFNPHFIGRVKSDQILGLTLDERDDDPDRLLAAIRTAPDGLHGFRYFQDHDPRVLPEVLNDPLCAKIILSRNPLDSYLSLKIVRKTKQWQLKNIKRRLEETVAFDAAEFSDYVDTLASYQTSLLNHLQRSGQTAFYINYDDLSDLEVLNGLAKWLGVDGRLDALDDTLKPQNPSAAVTKVTNPDEMARAASGMDRFALYRTPDLEPRRAPKLQKLIAAPTTPLVFLPVPGGLEPVVTQWLTRLDGCDKGALHDIPDAVASWMQTHPGHRKFTVLQHPIARAHTAFCDYVLAKDHDDYADIRHMLRNRFKLPIPGQLREKNYSKDQHHAAFAAFLTFLHHNLKGQTPIRVDAMWCSQSKVIEAMTPIALPDLILREDDLQTALPDLAISMGHTNPPTPESRTADTPYGLEKIYDSQLEALAAKAYQRDYVKFGFDAWR